MRFSGSTHLLMFLSLETLRPIIRTSLPILVKLINLVNSVIILWWNYNRVITLLKWSYLKWATRFPDCDSHSPALLDLFVSSGDSICSTMAFLPLRNSDHVVVSVSIESPLNSQRDSPFDPIAYDYSCAD